MVNNSGLSRVTWKSWLMSNWKISNLISSSTGITVQIAVTQVGIFLSVSLDLMALSQLSFALIIGWKVQKAILATSLPSIWRMWPRLTFIWGRSMLRMEIMCPVWFFKKVILLLEHLTQLLKLVVSLSTASSKTLLINVQVMGTSVTRVMRHPKARDCLVLSFLWEVIMRASINVFKRSSHST